MKKCVVYGSVAAILLLNAAVALADCSPSLMWQTSGTTAWTTDCAKVGIGTNDPFAKFEVSGGNKIGLDVTNSSIWLSNPTAPNSYSGVNYDRIGIGFRADVATITTEASGTPGIQRAIQINPHGRTGIFLATSGNIGMGTTSPGINGMSNTLTVQGADTRGMLELATGQGDADGVGAGQVGFFAKANTVGNQQIAAIYSWTSGTTPNNRGGLLTFWTKPDAGGLSEVMRLDRSGKLGIGTTAPQALLHVGAGADVPVLLSGTAIYASNSGNTYITARDSSTDIDVAFGAATGYGGLIGTRSSHDLYFQSAGNNRMILKAAGNLGIGFPASNPNPAYMLDVNGHAHFSGAVTAGNIQAHYQDVAEWVPVTAEMQPGTVVVVDGSSNNTVAPSSHRYDTRVAGVVSAQPGLILGIEAPSKEMIATTGRVKVRVDASSAPIQLGDLLVTSDKPGVAMRSEGIDLGGVKIHRPGTLIGKALEPLAKGEGKILVLLSLQ